MDKYIGRKLDGRYEIRELIGVGGMANVYKAFDVLENRIVEQGYLPEPRKKAFEGAPRASSAYKRLAELGDALAALIRRSQGRDNKTLADFAESLRKILEKFKF